MDPEGGAKCSGTRLIGVGNLSLFGLNFVRIRFVLIFFCIVETENRKNPITFLYFLYYFTGATAHKTFYFAAFEKSSKSFWSSSGLQATGPLV